MPAYSSFFSAVYDPFLAWGERGGMHELRRGLLAEARGDVLEIGAGTGLNAPLYGAIGSLTLTEPDPAMAARLRRRAAREAPAAIVVEAGAERLPFADDAFDTVVSTLVLCTVPDAPAALVELRRVLRPGGRLLLVEHVRAEDPGRARWQDRLHTPWMHFGCGCHCNRDTVGTLRAAGFETEALRPARWRRMPPIVAPLVVGAARMTL